jgi:hypothetical protein
MGKFVLRFFVGAVVGLGMGVSAFVLSLAMGDCLLSRILVDGPINALEHLNRSPSGPLYDTYAGMYGLLGVYWMAVGEVCCWGIVAFRLLRRRRLEVKPSSFPVKEHESREVRQH